MQSATIRAQCVPPAPRATRRGAGGGPEGTPDGGGGTGPPAHRGGCVIWVVTAAALITASSPRAVQHATPDRAFFEVLLESRPRAGSAGMSGVATAHSAAQSRKQLERKPCGTAPSSLCPNICRRYWRRGLRREQMGTRCRHRLVLESAMSGAARSRHADPWARAGGQTPRHPPASGSATPSR